jgi:phosphoglycolate phosphatase-like HAD superfamily hydrolase
MLRYLVLFDIDGTLLWPDGIGRASMTAALLRVYGTQGGIDGYNFGGKTDRNIVSDVLAGEDITPKDIDARFDELCRVMAEELTMRIPQHAIRPLAGGQQLVERLRAREDVLMGLVTGNCERTAFLKLEAANFVTEDLRVGAYGSERADRADLPPLAVERAWKLSGQRFEGSSIVVIGDTPADIACARSVNARTVAVASGWVPMETLGSHSPDVLLPDLSDTDKAIEAILV